MEQNLTLHPCRPIEQDARQVMEWRNDPGTLAMFFHREPKKWPDFFDEFKETYFLCEQLPPVFAVSERGRVAFVRFGVQERNAQGYPVDVDISINVAPKLRGKGVGLQSLQATAKFLSERKIGRIISEVRTENEASCRLFERAGYSFVREADKLIEDTGEICRIKIYHNTLPAS